MSTAAGAVLAAVLGALAGTFLTQLSHRLPRGESLLRPGPRCPSCSAAIRPVDGLPILGWLLLRGRCRACGERVSWWRYPLVEAATGLLCAAVVVRYGADADALLGLAFVVLLVPVTVIDIDFRIIPNVLMAIGAVVAIALVLATEAGDLTQHLIAALAGGGFFLIAALAYPAGMGMGDVKLAGVMGLFLGRAVAPAIFVALVSGTLVGAFVIARLGAREGRKAGIPFGPWLALGGLVGLFAGDAFLDWYLDTLG